MRAKKLFALLLAGSMMASVLTGCWGGGKDDNASSGTDGDSDITWTDPDYDEDEVDPVVKRSITVNAGENATVDGKTSPVQLTVNDGKDAIFTITANEGYEINTISIDGKSIQNGSESLDGALPSDKVTVTLKNVSADHTVTVECKEKTFTVTATVSGGNGTVSPTTQTVTYDGSASITVTPDQYYVVDTVTATMVGSENVTPKDKGDNTYTVENVTGDVEFTVTFKKASVVSVSISGTPKTSYKIDEAFDLAALTAKVTYEAGSGTEDIILSNDAKNVTIKIDGAGTEYNGYTFEFSAAGSYTVIVQYTVGGVTGKATYENVTVNALDKEDVEEINKDFTTAVDTWSETLGNKLTIGKNDDNLLAKAKEAETNNKDTFTVGEYFWRTDYKFKKGVVSGPDYNKQITDFFSNTVKTNLEYERWSWGSTYTDYRDADVYIEVDQQSGSCTMWVIWED